MLRALLLLLYSSFLLLPENLPQLHVHILDPGKRPIPQARISVTNQSSRTIFSGTTNASGDFAVPLAPGQYQVDIQRDGFEEQRTTIMMTQRDQQLTVLLRLKKRNDFDYCFRASDEAGYRQRLPSGFPQAKRE